MHQTLARLSDEFAASVHGLDGAQTQLRPGGRPDAWTIQQVAEHLMMTYAQTRKAMESRLMKATATKARATVQNRAAQFAVTRLGYFPNGRAAPEWVQPGTTDARTGAQLADAYAAALEAMDASLREVERMLGSGRTVTHFLLGPMSAEQWRRFHLSHGRHHFKQIRKILQQDHS